MEGAREYTVNLKVYHDLHKITVIIRVHKESRWKPENLYISLPFTTGEQEELYIDKTGCIIRPGIDQLLGSNKEFYLLQKGICYKGKDKSLILAIKNDPLIAMGDLKNHQIGLCNGKNYNLNKSVVYSWVMNNFWKTNFKVDLGGFYQFKYKLYTIHENN
ncbi:hypothetical protein PQ692_10920 [Thermoanaerobacterium thermosaccharolyticum]|uniref:hypothetical protein n=1 Tax=Thermoanaerobacterium thermosaccharolyticum TaxID=1517 RepID=UPI003DA93C50